MAHHLSHDTKSRIVCLDARPEPVAIDTASTAVIVVDMQNDFGAKGGLFDRAGIDISGIQKVVVLQICTFTGKYAMVISPLRGEAHGTRSRDVPLLSQ